MHNLIVLIVILVLTKNVIQKMFCILCSPWMVGVGWFVLRSNEFVTHGVLVLINYYLSLIATIDISASEFTGVLQKALLSVTVSLPWVNHTTAVFYSLSISGKQLLHVLCVQHSMDRR